MLTKRATVHRFKFLRLVLTEFCTRETPVGVGTLPWETQRELRIEALRVYHTGVREMMKEASKQVCVCVCVCVRVCVCVSGAPRRSVTFNYVLPVCLQFEAWWMAYTEDQPALRELASGVLDMLEGCVVSFFMKGCLLCAVG